MAEEKESPPAGVRPIWIQMKNYDKYGLREQGAEAGNMTMLNLFVVLERAHLLDEVGKYGFMCDWNDFKVCGGSNLVIVGYPYKKCVRLIVK